MPKQKSHKGLLKRVRVTATGKIVRGQAGRRHLLTTKSRKRKRQLRRKAGMVGADLKRTFRALRLA